MGVLCLFFCLESVQAQQWLGSGLSTGNIWRTGNVRIGANGSPLAGVKLQVENGVFYLNSSNSSFRLGFPSADGWNINTINAGKDIQFFSETSPGTDERRFVIRQNGNFGFNIFPTTTFDMYNETAEIAELRLQGGRSGGIFTPSRISFWSDPRNSGSEWRPAYIQSVDAGSFTGGLAFFTNGSGGTAATGSQEVMRLINKRVGIGTSSPNYPVEITADDLVGLQYNGPRTTFAGTYMNGGLPFYGYKQAGDIKAYHYLDANQNFRFWLNGSEKMVLTANGALGVGISAPERPIHLTSYQCHLPY